MKGGFGELLLYAAFVVILACGALFAAGALSIGERVLPAGQVEVYSGQPDRINPKGYNSEDDLNWGQSNKAQDQGYADVLRAQAEAAERYAQATSIIANAPVGINPNNDGSMGSGIIIGIIGVVFLLGFIFLNVGKR